MTYRTQSTPEDRLRKARTALLLDHPWFGALSLRLRLEASDRIPSMSVDGTTLTYNPDWAAQQSDPLLRSYWATEVVRCALLHPYRMQGRDAKTWREASLNVACQIVKAAGLPLWAGAPDNPEYADLAVEDVYARLQRAKQDQPESGDGDGPAGQPGMEPAPKPDGKGKGQPGDQPGQNQTDGDGADDEGMGEGDWQIAGEQAAMVARKAGRMPGNADRMLKATRESATDWRTLLKRFIEATVPHDYSWASPNRRYVAQGIYLPGITKENLPRIGIAVDTSGSVDAAMLTLFSREITAILHEARPAGIDVVYADYDVQSTESFDPDDAEVILHAKGGGGTRFQPALSHFVEADEPPVCMLYLTDLENGGERLEEPSFPVLWVVPAGNRRTKGPFGESIVLDPESR